MKFRFGYFFHKLSIVSIILALLLALILSLGRLLMAEISHYRMGLAFWASTVLEQPVKIAGIATGWQGMKPVIRLNHVTVLNRSGTQALLEVQQLGLTIDLWRSLIYQRLILAKLAIVGGELRVAEDAKGQVQLVGMAKFQPSTANTPWQELVGWLMTKRHLALSQVIIHWQRYQGPVVDWFLPVLNLANQNQVHQLQGELHLANHPQRRIRIIAKLEGNWQDAHSLQSQSYLEMSHLPTAQLLPQALQHHLALAELSAKVWLKWQRGHWQSVQSEFTAQQVSWLRPAKPSLNFSHLAGHALWQWQAPGRSMLQLSQVNLRSDLGGLFRQPITIDTLNGQVAWQQQQNDWQLLIPFLSARNGDIETLTRGHLQLLPSGSEYVDLLSQFTLKHIAAKSAYLPVRIMPKGVVHWLDQAIVGGSNATGRMVLRGKMADFPFDKGEGQFQIISQFNDVDLAFLPNWPMLTHFSGTMNFTKRRMSIQADSAQLQGIPVKADASIADLGHQPVLMIHGSMATDLATAQAFINHSPLKSTVGLELSPLQLSGPAQLDLRLKLPLYQAIIPVSVSGILNLQQASVQLLGGQLSLNQLQGPIYFTEHNLSAPLIQAKALGQALQLSITSPEQTAKTQVQVTTALKVSELTPYLKPMPAWLRAVAGQLPLQLELAIAHHHSHELIHGYLRSNLQGLSIDLPWPLAKTAQQARLSELAFTFDAQHLHRLEGHYGDILSAALGFNAKSQLSAGEIRLGAKDATLPQQGFRVLGQWPSIELEQWQAWLAQQAVGLTAAKQTWPMPEVQVWLKQLTGWGQQWQGVNVTFMPLSNHWQLKCSAPGLKLTVTSPQVPQQPWQISAQQLYLAKLTDAHQDRSLKPQAIPSLDLHCQDCRYSDYNLGAVDLRLRQRLNTLSLEQLSIDNSDFTVSSTGIWQALPWGMFSQLKGSLMTHAANGLTALGKWQLPIKAKTATMQFHLTWPGSLLQPQLAKAQGKFELQLQQGEITDIGESATAKLRLGQLLNILSLQTLARHLSLNFTDLAEQGFAFSRLQGQLHLSHGQLSTRNLLIEGPVADIQLTGHLALIAQTYHLQLHITPHLMGNLPILATLAAGPLVGAVTWLADQVLAPGLKQVTSQDYQLQGQWGKSKD